MKNTTTRNSAANKRKSAETKRKALRLTKSQWAKAELRRMRAEAEAEDAKDANATQTKDPAQLTDKQIESLMDDLLCASNHQAAVTNPLLIIMDEITRSPFDFSRVESIAATVKRHAYSTTCDADGQEERYIRQIRADALQAVA